MTALRCVVHPLARTAVGLVVRRGRESNPVFALRGDDLHCVVTVYAVLDTLGYSCLIHSGWFVVLGALLLMALGGPLM